MDDVRAVNIASRHPLNIHNNHNADIFVQSYKIHANFCWEMWLKLLNNSLMAKYLGMTDTG